MSGSDDTARQVAGSRSITWFVPKEIRIVEVPNIRKVDRHLSYPRGWTNQTFVGGSTLIAASIACSAPAGFSLPRRSALPCLHLLGECEDRLHLCEALRVLRRHEVP